MSKVIRTCILFISFPEACTVIGYRVSCIHPVPDGLQHFIHELDERRRDSLLKSVDNMKKGAGLLIPQKADSKFKTMLTTSIFGSIQQNAINFP